METLKLDLQNVMDYLDSKLYEEEFVSALEALKPKELGEDNLHAVSKLFSFKQKVEQVVLAYRVLKSMSYGKDC